MFHRLGKGTNGGYQNDPIYKRKSACALDLEVSA